MVVRAYCAFGEWLVGFYKVTMWVVGKSSKVGEDETIEAATLSY